MKAIISTSDHLFIDSSFFLSSKGLKIQMGDTPRQSIIGFGGAFTESSASVYASLPRSSKNAVLDLLFGKDGLNYSLGRLTIGSSDFSLREYDYSSKDDLSDFSLSHDKKEIIPFLKNVFDRRPLTLLASSWSPLAKWKTNNNKCGGGHLLPECYDIYSSYIQKYVEGYKALNLPISALTIQNEPEAVQSWESCIFSPDEERKLLLFLHNKMPDIHLYIHDHNRDRMLERSKEILSTAEALEATTGIAYHWYDRDSYKEVEKTKEAFTNKNIIFTEGCIETLQKDYKGPKSFASALRYAKNYCLGLEYGTSAFIDWNLLLDEIGGPNHVGNFCESPIMRENKNILVNPSYFAIKHFSYFIKPGARSVKVKIDKSPKALFATGVINPDNSKIIILVNEGEEAIITLPLGPSLVIPPSSIATIVL